MANTLTLNCLVIPDASPESITRHSITTLKISSNETVDLLRPMIKERWSSLFENILPTNFILRKIDSGVVITIYDRIRQYNNGASTFTTVAGNETVSLADEIKKYKMKELIDFLRKEEDLELEPEDYNIIEKERVNGRAFLKVTEEKLRSYGMAGGPATVLADFAKECKEKKKRSFSTYKTQKDLKAVLAKYNVKDGRITDIPQFIPRPHSIDDKNEALVGYTTQAK